MSPEYAGDAKGYLQYPKPSGSIDPQHIVVNAASLAVAEMNSAFNWINEELIGEDLDLDFKLDDTPSFFAQCKVTASVPSRALTIYVGLGCIPSLVGITNRLLQLQRGGPLMLEIEMQGRHDVDAEKWHPRENRVGALIYDYVNKRNTSTSTADAILLIFFHEVAHALRGHHWLPPAENVSAKKHRRALESDADFCAGYLFMKYQLKKLSDENRSYAENLDELCERLAVAAASLNCALQIWRSDVSELYHLPQVRIKDNIMGSYWAWHELNISRGFIELINKAHGHLASLDHVLGFRLEQWIAEDDSRNIDDEKERGMVTEPIIQSIYEKALTLERGPIRGVRTLSNSIMKRRENYRPVSFYSYSPILFQINTAGVRSDI